MLLVLTVEQAPRTVKLDVEKGAHIRRTRDAPTERLLQAAEATLSGVVLAVGVGLMWLILRDDRRG